MCNGFTRWLTEAIRAELNICYAALQRPQTGLHLNFKWFSRKKSFRSFFPACLLCPWTCLDLCVYFHLSNSNETQQRQSAWVVQSATKQHHKPCPQLSWTQQQHGCSLFTAAHEPGHGSALCPQDAVAAGAERVPGACSLLRAGTSHSSSSLKLSCASKHDGTVCQIHEQSVLIAALPLLHPEKGTKNSYYLEDWL